MESGHSEQGTGPVITQLPEILACRAEEVFLRLRVRGLEHLEARLRSVLGVVFTGRFHVQCVAGIGGQCVLLAAVDLARSDRRLCILKFPLIDWVRPGRVAIRELETRRATLAREGELLQRAGGVLLPGWLASFRELNPLVEEPQPRIAPDEQFLAMEYIPAESLDIVARREADSLGRRTPSFHRWVCRTLRTVTTGLMQLRKTFSELIYTDIAPRNFLFPSTEELRIVDAGSLVPIATPLQFAPSTLEYCPLDDVERRQPSNEGTVVRRLAVLGLDMLTDQISLGTPIPTVLRELLAAGPSPFVKLLATMTQEKEVPLAEFAVRLNCSTE